MDEATLSEHLRCPITRQTFRDPVVAADGHTYEREAIKRWFGATKRSPLTGALLTESILISNCAMRSLVGRAFPTSALAAHRARSPPRDRPADYAVEHMYARSRTLGEIRRIRQPAELDG